MTQRFVCIHGHFYQPPRENPWLEYVERQETAQPYHDWNERITEECYANNAAARILDKDGHIEAIHNNYARMSFNFGPTLLSWMERWAPATYAAILDADKQSAATFSGHGSAIAQAYNHIIMPLANARDKITQVEWGIRDFERRFGRDPEGMWLPEAAVDTGTLEVLADHGITFTVLAPNQTQRVRPIGSNDWHDVSGARVDPRMPYVTYLPSGKSIVLFFYDGPISRAVAFENLLKDGVAFANRVVSVFSDGPPEAQLAHIAVDGETFGHHHRHGEMALAYAFRHIKQAKLARVTNYGEYLALVPPTHEAIVAENTSWSCVHGVERWRANCGCNMGRYPDQSWRKPLRDSLNWLRDQLIQVFEERGPDFFHDPWAARNGFIDVILDRSQQTVHRFFDEHCKRKLDEHEHATALQMLEMQRHAMLMFTSCGWFFDDLSRIEAVQILCYAARAMQLAEDVNGVDLEPVFIEKLAFARSNLQSVGNGRQLFETMVEPTRVSLASVAAHYAIRSLFEPDSDRGRVYCYRVERDDFQEFRAGMAKLALGKITVISEITERTRQFCFSVLHFGDHTINGGVHDFISEEAYAGLRKEVAEAFRIGDLAKVLRLLDDHYHELKYSIGSLFRDEQRRVLDSVLAPTLEAAETKYRDIYETHAPLMRFLRGLNLPAPPAIQAAGEFVLNTSLRNEFEADRPNLEEIHRLLDEVRETAVRLDEDGIGYAASHNLENGMRNVAARIGDLAVVQSLRDLVATVRDLPFVADLAATQNIYFTEVTPCIPEVQLKASAGDIYAARWVDAVRSLGEVLGFRIPA